MVQEKRKRTVLITGASKGLGKALAFEFARCNFNVVLCARNTDLLKVNTDEISAKGGSAVYIRCDVTNPAELERAIQYTMDTFGQIDIAVFNAGIGGSTTFDNFDFSTFDNVIRTNLTGVVNGISLVAKVMKQQHFGTIVGISTLNDSHPIPGGSPYVASKKALNTMLEAASIELQSYGIHVVTVRPGFIKTELTSKNVMYMPLIMEPSKAAKIIIRGILKGRTRISFPLLPTFLSAFGKILPTSVWKYVLKLRG